MIHLVAILLAWAGFCALALSMSRHQRDLIGRALVKSQAASVRWAGWGLLAVTFVLDIAILGGGYGAVAWCAHLSVGAWLAIAVLHWRKA